MKIKQLLRDIGPDARKKRSERRHERKRLRDVWPLQPPEDTKKPRKLQENPFIDDKRATVQGATAPSLMVSPFTVLPTQSPPPALSWQTFYQPPNQVAPASFPAQGPPMIYNQILAQSPSPLYLHPQQVQLQQPYYTLPLPHYPNIQLRLVKPSACPGNESVAGAKSESDIPANGMERLPEHREFQD